MTIFEMVFNLIGLVLGLALVEVLGGLWRKSKQSWQTRQTFGRSSKQGAVEAGASKLSAQWG